MVDFEDEATKVETNVRTQGDKKPANFFAQVRSRGMLNAGLDSLVEEFQAANPDRVAKWEYYNPAIVGGTDIVMSREALGYRVVQPSEIPSMATSIQKEGPIRRGDLALIACSREVYNMQRLQDAQAAEDDLRAPAAAFAENVGKNTVTLSSGESASASTFGNIKRSVEEVTGRPSGDSD